MEKNKTRTVETERPEDNARRKASRRSVLRGAATAAPAVFTLPLSANVAAESFVRCVGNNNESPDYQHTPGADDWARQEIGAFYVQQVKKNGQNNGQNNGQGGGQTVLLVDYGDICIDDKNRRWERTWDGYYISPNGKTYERVAGAPDRYTLAYVNDDGEFIGVHPRNSNNGQPVTASCYASIAIARNGKGNDRW